MMVVGIDGPSSYRAVALARSNAGIYAAVGVHPHLSKDCSRAVLQSLDRLAGHSRVLAWGEIGLDFNRMYSPVDLQEKWLLRQLEMADNRDLPIILHERDSGGRLMEMLAVHQRAGRQAVVHCFSGDRLELDAYVKMGFHIGITGIVTLAQRGRQLRRLVAHIPDERLLMETDAPYLTPAPQKNRLRRNEPALVVAVLLKLAHLKQQDPRELAALVWQNSCRFFKIPIQPDDRKRYAGRCNPARVS